MKLFVRPFHRGAVPQSRNQNVSREGREGGEDSRVLLLLRFLRPRRATQKSSNHAMTFGYSTAACLLFFVGTTSAQLRAQTPAPLADLTAKAQQGDVEAQASLGWRYASGTGVPQNDREAAKWFRLAADRGNTSSQFNLALMYEKGQGVSKDLSEAAKWYKLAAEQSHVSAQNNLGLCYYNGLGVAKDYKEALRWFRSAADQGDPSAQHNLAVMYLKGHGLAANLIEAHKWFSLAAEQGEQNAAKTLALLAKQMKPEQVKEAERRAANFRQRKAPAQP